MNNAFPIILNEKANGTPIKIAVVDDAFNLSHQSLRAFVFENKGENPFNDIDDDLNGYVDDYKGYDVSDLDNKVGPPEQSLDDYYHGTFISGAICDILSDIMGNNASAYFKIIPIKSTSNNADPRLILDGYKGIEYAMSLNPDIIVCAWSGGTASPNEKEIVKKALSKGINVIAAAGNELSQKARPPADIEGVLSVAALDSMYRKYWMSNYGKDVDISAPGEHWRVPWVGSNYEFIDGKATSLSTAIVAAFAAIGKAINPNLSAKEINRFLVNTASPLEQIQSKYSGLLGSGFINPDRFLSSLIDSDFHNNSSLPEGYIDFSKIKQAEIVEITPQGDFHETVFRIEEIGKELHDFDLFVKTKNDEDVQVYSLNDFFDGLKVSGTNLKVWSDKSSEIVLSYESILLDSTNYYCSTLVESNNSSGVIHDGSGLNNYTNETNCKWMIEAPKGKRISFVFDKIDTEPNTDLIYFFDGSIAIQDNMIARFSGQNLPPHIISRTNQVLIWFVTNETISGQGWSLDYEFVD